MEVTCKREETGSLAQFSIKKHRHRLPVFSRYIGYHPGLFPLLSLPSYPENNPHKVKYGSEKRYSVIRSRYK